MIKRVLILLIKIYRVILCIFQDKSKSPLNVWSSCKYYPTCSLYALQAIEKYGALRGMYLSIIRVLKCNPFSKGGFDPVP